MLNGRLVGLRPTRTEDLDFLADLANLDQVRHNVGGWHWPVARETQPEWLRRSQADQTVQRLTVADPVTDEPWGLTGLWEIDWHNRSALTAIKLMPGAAPRGAGSDAIMLVMAWSFYDVGLRRLHGSILPFNTASLGAYVRNCGWRVEGRDREAVFRRGEWHDLLRVGILRADFDALTAAEEYVERVCGPATSTIPGQSGPGVRLAVAPDGLEGAGAITGAGTARVD
ncbi:MULTISPECIES: GNAT family N-acetyltransferase [Micromonospora]|nr:MULTISPECIES: GNAT family protein [Micromonospora]NES15407.1 GNAT family N-acetyltransferase [Micromonospora sp. PPF5-17B]NES35847.1 GNAT family N-acetyltransferase [Micromonospora solifontis]NES58001.1 GNAT family N-acetyltransferase [Micromonospora sp. PPF5-6]